MKLALVLLVALASAQKRNGARERAKKGSSFLKLKKYDERPDNVRKGAITNSEDDAARRVSKNIRKFGWYLINNSKGVNENVVVSPLSIAGAMYMLAAGAGGETRDEILYAFGVDYRSFGTKEKPDISMPFKAYKKIVDGLSEQDKYTCVIANALFSQKAIKSNSPQPTELYKNILQETFIRDVANFQQLDFKSSEATDTINSWVADKTNNKIPKLFKEPLPSSTLLVLASSLYFKASWAEKFEKAGGQECWTSSVESGCNDDVQFMTNKGMEVYKGRVGNKFTVIDIPMAESPKESGLHVKPMMQIWLPEDYITEAEVEEKMLKTINENYANIRRTMRLQKAKVTMPKFSVTSDLDMGDILESYGVSKAFSDQADLTPMLGERSKGKARVEKVNHAVQFDVDENGVEGAAVTAITIGWRSATELEQINIDRPFYFVLDYKCLDGNGSCSYPNVPLFIGKITDPTK